MEPRTHIFLLLSTGISIPTITKIKAMRFTKSCLSFFFLPALLVSGEGSVRKLQEAPPNDVCESAILVNASSVLAGTAITGSTANAELDSIRCTPQRTAVYYKFRSTGARYRVTTCHDATDYDSALIVDNGNCDNFGCQDHSNEHDFDCDPAGMGATVEFYAEPDSLYTVAVTGTTVAGSGNFGLSIQEYVVPENNACEDSTLIQPTNHGGITVLGSTANATFNDFRCEVGDKLAVYYRFVGTGGPILISTCSNETNFNSALAVMEDCSSCPLHTSDHDFDCDEEGMGSTIEFLSEENVPYIVAVRGVTANDAGDFGLMVHEFVRPSNDVCTEAIRIQPATKQPGSQEVLDIPVASSKQEQDDNNNITATFEAMSMVYTTTVAYGSTSNSTTSSFRCNTGDYAVAFYTIAGTGQRMRASTCTREVELDFDTEIVVTTGLCDSGNPTACNAWWNEHDFECQHSPSGLASTVEWETEPNTIYTVAVRGLDGSQRGDFGLSLEAFGNATTSGGTGTCRWVQVCD
ncbi:expressed unknown protein [Seminavis robusta]|uniref:Uncharacterized protein n=1 Tax=Seminavis robusta TaxID=568900 RepID=A0A9N8EZY1_9STRA|nr:expressed unknown protein [Seminavis robusta]|eukprot:Sro2285_g321980.1 n/a (521) ;mRNA; r:10407-12058